ncbi:MAG: sulfatase-like hydrolase/transferase [Pirellulaceae bacterium]|nr:sulfatase-like hydrolase/transferase [Pirellulaceae bacterium]
MRHTFSILAVAIGLACLPVSLLAAEARKPNFIYFLSDDEGYGELGAQGNKEIPTPHIDSIAAGGIRFTQGYVSGPYCSPTRAGLMTGRYQTRFGHEWNGNGPNFGLPLTETTIANRLKDLGYATCAVGKWHLGEADQFLPTKRGFDEFYGTKANTPFFHPTIIDTRVSTVGVPITDDNFYTTDAYAERACDWIEKNKEKPFFLYLPFNAQHAPLQATAKYLDRFPNITDEKRKIFAAMMSAKDDAVGKVLAKLKEIGQFENTLVVYHADNGGPTPSTTSKNDPLRGYKAQTWEGGIRVPFMLQWPAKLPAGKVYEHPVIQLDMLPTFVSAAGGEVKADWKLDGVNLLPYLEGKFSDRPHATLYWRFGEQMAIRHGDYKLVKAVGITEPALFNLATDIGEKNDLIATEGEKAKELSGIWDKWNAEQEPARWRPNPNNKKKAGKKAKAAAQAQQGRG